MTTAASPGDKVAASGWNRSGQENKFRAGAEVRQITGTGTTVFLGIETANDPRNPDSGYVSAWAVGVTTNTIKDSDSTLVTLGVAGKMYWRWVWVIYTTSGLGFASVNGWGETMDT